METTEDMSTAVESLDPDALIDEIRRYLAAIDTFRREGHEPCWRDIATA
jgi:hypothetical protein